MGRFLFSCVLFGLWVVLSGKLDAFHLGVGVVTALLVALLAGYLINLPPAIGTSLAHPLQGVAWFRVAAYIPWLAWQIALSSVEIARVVFDPKLPIRPRIVRFASGLPHTLARLTLAHSITLTPGTVTLDIEDDEFVVHALTNEAADDIERGSMQHAAAQLFSNDHGEHSAR